MSLQLDYRPGSLDLVVGNPGLKMQLRTWMKRADRSRCILLHGPTGCGKTTVARILATELKVYDPEVPAANNPDYKELNNADWGGKDIVDYIRDTSQLMPMKAKCRVFVFDECHGLTPKAQDGLLKIMENPPKHVYYIFATAEPDKLDPMFRRRCTEFTVELVEEGEMAAFLKEISESDAQSTGRQTTVPENILRQIAEYSLGSPGVALKMLDGIIGLDPADMEVQATRMVESTSNIKELINGLQYGKDWSTIARILKGLSGEDHERVRRGVLGYVNAILLNGKLSPELARIMFAFKEPYYATGRNGLTLSCLTVIMAKR